MKCKKCNGTGFVSLGAGLRGIKKCEMCNGKGRIMKMKCKYEQKANLGDKYIKCGRDGSIRRYPCHCNKHEPTFWEKLKTKFGY